MKKQIEELILLLLMLQEKNMLQYLYTDNNEIIVITIIPKYFPVIKTWSHCKICIHNVTADSYFTTDGIICRCTKSFWFSFTDANNKHTTYKVYDGRIKTNKSHKLYYETDAKFYQ